MAAAPTTRLARSRHSVTRPKSPTVAKRARTPLPTSSQLTLIIGASTSKPDAPVALSRRCQAIQLTSVVMPATKKRRRKRAQGQAARATAVSTPATMADKYVTDTPYISTSPSRAPRAEPGHCCSCYTSRCTRTCSSGTRCESNRLCRTLLACLFECFGGAQYPSRAVRGLHRDVGLIGLKRKNGLEALARG